MGRGIRFTAEFKREAVRLASTSARPRAEIAEDLGVGLSSLTRRVGQFRGGARSADCPIIHGSAVHPKARASRLGLQSRQSTRAAEPPG